MSANTMIMASSQSMLAGRSASAKPFSGQAIKPTRAVALPRSRAYVVKAVAKDDHQGPSKLALGLFGALAAAQLALLPAGPAEAFNLFPKTATSQAARDKLNKKTDDLPTVAEAGKELVGGSDPIGANNPKDVGKAVDKATPDVDLTKNPKSLGKDLAKGAKNALPDVSAVPTREEIIANAKKGRSAAGSVASQGQEGRRQPLSGCEKPLLEGVLDPTEGGPERCSRLARTRQQGWCQVRFEVRRERGGLPAPQTQKKLSCSPGALPNPKGPCHHGPVNTPMADPPRQQVAIALCPQLDIEARYRHELQCAKEAKTLSQHESILLAGPRPACPRQPVAPEAPRFKQHSLSPHGPLPLQLAGPAGAEQNNQVAQTTLHRKEVPAGKPSDTIGAIP
ncbi:TPA: hypothetical protein ACH3X2_013593 [Trebouxia sp. C0005]